MFLHNVFLVMLSVYMSVTSVAMMIKYNYNFWGNAYSSTESGMHNIVGIFYVSKLYEFVDTFIMLIKGNLQQVSFLHVYHHASISICWWIIAYYAPGGDAWYSVALNSLVHVIMYAYYLLASLIGKRPTVRAKYLWWGKYLTQFQMLQFVSMMAQAAYCMAYSPYPVQLSTMLFGYMITLLALFLNFYLRKHGAPAKKAKRT